MEVLASLLDRNIIRDERVVVGPAIGEDAAVLDVGTSNYLIAKTDPITFTAENIGGYAVHINANDIATMGGDPKWFLATLLLPEGLTDQRRVEEIFQEIVETCQSLGISLIGGHTEITHGLDRPIVVGQMLGEVEKDKLVRTGGAREGDAILLTKGIAVEGTAIIAREKEGELIDILGREMLSSARGFLRNPGLSVVKDARVSTVTARVHSMHDPTEGGLATALHEVARAAEVGLILNEEEVLIFPETRRICNHYHLDPLGLIASGSLLVILNESDAPRVVARLEEEGIPSRVIGRVVDKRKGVKLQRASDLIDLPLFEQDELTKILT